MDLDLNLVVAIYTLLLLLLLASGMWVACVMGVLGVAMLYVFVGAKFAALIAQFTWNTLNEFAYVALPLFIFLGYLLMEGGLANRIYSGLKPVLDHFPGGLLHTNIVAGALFASASGSSIASAATIGTMALPEMERRGYSRGISAGSVAAGGVLAPLIPPSILMIVYAIMVDESIGRLFLAGIVPGILLTLAFIIYIAVRVRMKPQYVGKTEVLPWRQSLLATGSIWPILVLIAVVLGTIYAGIASPTEAAAMGCIAALVMVALYRNLKLDVLRRSLIGTIKLTSMVMFIVKGGKIMTISLAHLGVGSYIAEVIAESGLPPMVIIGGIYLLYILLGMIMDGISMLVLTLPTLYPVVIGLGFDSVWYGIAMTMLGEMALLTPPVALNLYVIHGLQPDRSFGEIARGAVPFAVITLVILILITILPQLVLFLPNSIL
jgi:tripartite ATP-independent transporter DctM subunit